MLILVLILQLLICAVMVALLIHLVFSLRGGLLLGPYVPSSWKITKIMVDLAEIKPGMKVLELGSGDGRIVVEAAKRGAIALGYELDPILVQRSRFKAWRAGVQDRVTFKQVNIWKQEWPADVSVVFLYALPRYMDKIWKHACERFAPGTIIISHAFLFHGVEPVKTEGIVRAYKIPEKKK